MFQPTPEISICIPTYNQTKYLKKLLDSILIQTFTDFEIIISDDSSTDDVYNLISSYRCFLIDKITYVRNTKPLGPPMNWNNSISFAKGKWIKIMHHDDCFSSSNSLQLFYNLTFLNENIDFVYSGSFYFNSKNERVNHSIDKNTFEYINKNPVSLFSGNLIGPPSSVMYKKKEIYFDRRLKWLVDIEFYYQYIFKTHSTNYTSEYLIESFIPEERVTNDCWMNKFVEVPEYLYCIHKHNINSISVLKHISDLFYKLGVFTKKDIKECGHSNKVPLLIFILIFINRVNNKIKHIVK
jgi:glycosyltransferase involved in cell wall biosynthesis